MNLRARVAFASGVAACVGAALLIAGRFEGSIVLAFFFAWSARLAPAATMFGAGPILASGAARTMRTQLILAPAWAFVVAAAAVRAGSVQLADVRGAHAVAGLALARGPLLTVIGAWVAFVAGVAATGAAGSRIGVVSEAPEDARGVVAPPSILRRMEYAGVVAQVMLLVTLFAGPQIDGASDSTWWAVGAVAAVAAVVALRRLPADPRVPIAAGVAGLIGLGLATIGGPP